MATGDDVTVVIPYKDRPTELARAVGSVAAQQLSPREIVVVDDGSRDPLVAPAAAGVPVRVVRQVNQGPAAARNRGVAEARTAWVAFLDSDDLWQPAKLATQIALLSRHPEAVWSATHATMSGEDTARFPLQPAGAVEGLVSDGVERLLPGYFISTSSVMARRDVFLAAGGFDERLWFCEDFDLWLRLAAAGPAAVSGALLVDVARRGGERLSDMERTPLAEAADIYVMEKVAADPAYDGHVRRAARLRATECRTSLAYVWRKQGHPVRSVRVAASALLEGGSMSRNVRTICLCWVDYAKRRLKGVEPAPAEARAEKLIRRLPGNVTGL